MPTQATVDRAVTTHGDAADWSARRADARRNHDEVLAAARRAFAERGESATVPEIAALAGVGKATVYRSYPTKAALVDAVASEHLAWLDERVRVASSQTDAMTALDGLLGDVVERLACDRLFSAVLGRAGRTPASGRRQGALAVLLERGVGEGRLREDVTTQDVHVLLGGIARVLLDLDVRDPRQWRRYTRMVLLALRPDERHG